MNLSRKDLPWLSQQEFDETMQGLITKGLVRKVDEDGKIGYVLTNVGAAVIQHMMSTDPKSRN